MASTTSEVSVAKTAPAPMNQPPNRWRPVTAKLTQRVAASIVAVILITVFAASSYFDKTTYEKSYDVAAVFYYYLGAKYFPEVGYFNLHTCALEADDEAGGYWYGIDEVRDMETYRIVPRSSLSPCPRTNFTAQRWSDFSRDVEYFALLARPTYFASALADKGFNPPPSWVVLARPLAQAVPISNRLVAGIVCNLDVIAVLIGVLIIWRSHGGIASLLTAALAIFYFGNFGRIGGNFLQYAWFPSLVAAVILWRQNRPRCSGAMLGLATALQIFPLFFGLPIVVRGIIDVVRGRKKAEWHPHIRFSGALTAVLLASFLLGSFSGRGVGVWGEWQKKISIHKNYLRGEIFDIGLANLTGEIVSVNHNDSDSYVDDVPNTFVRLDALERNLWIQRALCATFLAMWMLTVVSAPGGGTFSVSDLSLCTPPQAHRRITM
jgi:hypothetical protein